MSLMERKRVLEGAIAAAVDEKLRAFMAATGLAVVRVEIEVDAVASMGAPPYVYVSGVVVEIEKHEGGVRFRSTD